MKLIKLTFLLCLFLINGFAFAQTNVESLKKEIATLSESLKSEQEKTAYLKEVLDIRSNGKEIIQDSISIKITEVKGDLKTKIISVKGLVTYLGNTNRNIQFHQQTLIDPKGNIFDTYTAVKANDLKESIFIQSPEKDIPYGFAVLFKKVDENFPTASLIRLQVYGFNGAPDHKFNFKGLDVIWE